MDRIADAFVWPFRDPDALGKIAIVGLILIVPIVGGINGLGWMLAALERLRAGDERLSPGNFGYLGKGVELFVVFLVYYLAIVVVGAVLYVPALITLSTQGHGRPNALLVIVGLALLFLTVSVVTVASLAVLFAMPAIVLAVDRGGISAGLRVAQVVGRIRISLVNTLIAGLMLIAAGLVGQLGGIICIVGVFFTSAYALAMQAWIIRSYELGSASPRS